MTVFAASIAVALALLVVLDVARRPTIGRIGWRNLRRRPAETAVVIAGSMLATALIVASIVIGDSFGQSTRTWAAERFGETDELVTLGDADEARRLADALAADPGPIDGLAVLAVGAGSVVADDPIIELAVRPGAESVTVSRLFATEHDVTIGDPIELSTDTGTHTLVVDAVGDELLGDRLDVIVTTADVATYFADPTDVRHVVAVSNQGGALTGAERSDGVMARIEAVASDLGIRDADVQPVKADLIEIADADAAEMTSLFGTISGFSVTAGILLVVNLFVMLAAERRRELGLMRAIGLGRSVVVGSFLVEGAVTGAVAAVIGGLAGIGVAAGVLGYASSSLDEELLQLFVEPRSVILGALTGFAVSQLTVTGTSIRLARLDVVAALKGLSSGRATRRSRGRRVASLLAVTTGVLGVVLAGEVALVALAAPAVALVGVAGFVDRAAPRLALAGAAVAWPVAVFGLRPGVMTDPDVSVFLVQGLLMVGIGAWLTVLARPAWQVLARRIGGGRLGVRLGLAHPLDRAGRTSLLVAMYAIVLFTVTFLAVMTAVYGKSGPVLAEMAGGRWSVVVDAAGALAPDAEEVAATPGVEAVATVLTGGVEVQQHAPGGGGRATRRLGVAGVDAGWLAVTPPGLAARSHEFADDDAAWAAVATAVNHGGTHWVIAPGGLGYEVGETLTLGPTARPATVAGVTDYGWLIGADLYLDADLAADVGGSGGAERLVVAVAGGRSPDAVAGRLDARFGSRGVAARSLDSIAADELVGQKVFLQMLLGYLALGLFIGVAGLGVVLARGATERRQEIGVLAAIGVDGRSVSRSFVTEALFVGGQGTVLGIGLGLLSAWQVLTRTSTFDAGLSFVWPVAPLALIASACLAASVAAAVVPARRSRRVEPAAALRIAV